MSLVLKYKKFIDKIISDMEEDICKKITQDASVCNNIVDIILEYSDEYDITPEFDIIYYKTRISFNQYHLAVLNGDLKITEAKLKDSWNENGMIWGPADNHDNSSELFKYNSMIKVIEESPSKEIHIWMGVSEIIGGDRSNVEFHKIKSVSKEIVARINKMYPEMNPKIDMEDSPSLSGDELDLVIVLKA